MLAEAEGIADVLIVDGYGVDPHVEIRLVGSL